LAIRMAAQYPDRIAAAASYHAGRTVSDEPDSVHLLLPKVKTELYVAHADKDPSMTKEQIEKFDAAAKASGAKIKTEFYEGAIHGFVMLDLPVGQQWAVDRHWQTLLDLLRRNL